MTQSVLTQFFGWTTVLNFGFLILMSLALLSMRGFAARIHGKLFGLESADLSRAYFQYLAQYKIAIVVFSLVPYIALRLVT